MADGRITLEELKSWLQEFARLVAEQRAELSELDAAIGDGDHGTNMDRGMQAVVTGMSGETIGDLVKQAGMTLVSTVGGASGPLYGTFFLRFATSAGAVGELDASQFAAAMRAGLEGIVARGKAEPGDKTMFDALAPAVQTLEAGVVNDLAGTLAAAADAADKGRDATIEMLARKGRASYLGERSIGHQDPGATSAALLVHAAASALG
ncbi:MAG TPA: dihydroxyacetone kinase subunit DhaL [Jatrophihabitans sp.]|nr:dihydroxyacetone kinase subunit DhaL [Jatrophihabitans sp.]